MKIMLITHSYPNHKDADIKYNLILIVLNVKIFEKYQAYECEFSVGKFSITITYS